jgi:hypothetical protein
VPVLELPEGLKNAGVGIQMDPEALQLVKCGLTAWMTGQANANLWPTPIIVC